LAIFWTTRGSQFHQFALGLLLSSITLLILLSLVELLWQVLEPMFGSEHSDPTDRSREDEGFMSGSYVLSAAFPATMLADAVEPTRRARTWYRADRLV
jgi:hypothetical protein